MKIVCHMTSAHDNNDVRIFYKECCSIQRAGDYSVYLVAPGETFEKNGVKVIGVEVNQGGRFYRMTKTARDIYEKAVRINADIYHLHDPELLPYVYKLKKLGKIVIYDSHEDYPLNIREKHWIPKQLRPIISFLIAVYERKVVRKIDAVVTVTPQIKKRFDDWGVKSALITNYPILEDKKISYQIKSGQKILCFAGSIDRSRMHHYIVKALENTQDVQYDLAGTYRPENYEGELAALEGYAKVKYLGQLQREEVIQLYNRADMGIVLVDYLPIYYGHEGSLGVTKLFEYMEAGIPVICSDFSLWKEIVNTYQCGICVRSNDIHEIANAINYLVNNEEISKQMGLNGRKAVEKKFNWSIEEEKLINLYWELLGKAKENKSGIGINIQ